MSDWQLDSLLTEQFKTWLRDTHFWGKVSLAFEDGKVVTGRIEQTLTVQGSGGYKTIILKGDSK